MILRLPNSELEMINGQYTSAAHIEKMSKSYFNVVDRMQS